MTQGHDTTAVVGGLDLSVSQHWLGLSTWPENLTWLEASAFLDAAADHATDTDEAAPLWVWLYQGPWDYFTRSMHSQQDYLDTQAIQATLDTWRQQQRQLLRLKARLGPRLRIVNLTRCPAQTLATTLGIESALLSALPADTEVPTSAAQVAGTDLSTAASLAQWLAAAFALALPKDWDIYEALESSAWLPDGEPEFRDQPVALTEAVLLQGLQHLQNGLHLPAQIDKQQTLVEKLKAASAERDGLREENDLLLAQLHQAQEELEQRLLDHERLQSEHQTLQAQLKKDLERVQNDLKTLTGERDALLKQQKAFQDAEKKLNTDLKTLTGERDTLIGERNTLRATHTKLQSEHQSLGKTRDDLAEENELLITQLHQVQEELERYFLDHQKLQAEHQSLQTQHKKDLERVQNNLKTLTGERDALLKQQKTLQDTEKKLNTELQKLTRGKEDLNLKNKELITHLHAVQEELERYLLANRELSAALERSQPILERTQTILCQTLAPALSDAA